jgi:CRP/FNR family transcriptional regulator, cyclic AMP receptor protein
VHYRTDRSSLCGNCFRLLTKRVAFGIQSALFNALARFRGSAKCHYGSRWGLPPAVTPRFRSLPSRDLRSKSPVGRFRRRSCRLIPWWVAVRMQREFRRNLILSISIYCGLRWHKHAETSSGWELVQAMRSNNRGARALAAELLAETEDGRLLVRDLRRTRNGLRMLAGVAPAETGQATKGDGMITPYGLPIVEDCMHCPLRKDSWFCQLTSDLLKSFSAFSHLATYPGGAILFIEGQMPRGAFVLCSGKVKLSTTSREGKVLILKMVEPGEVMGLSAVISAEAYEITAETLEPSLVNFVDGDGLLRLMERSGELGLRSAQAVSREFQYAYREIHELVLARSSSGKLARLLLSWMTGVEKRKSRISSSNAGHSRRNGTTNRRIARNCHATVE